MPWEPEDAPLYTKKAATPRLQRLWVEIANQVLDKTGDEGRAIREANAVIARTRDRYSQRVINSADPRG
jgi:hypothetical protein